MVTSYAPDTNMKIICVEEVEEHATDSATDKAARPAAPREAPYFGLLDSPDAAPGPRNDLDDPRYAPVLGKLNELNVPLYAHPGIPLPDVQQAYYTGFSPQVTAKFSLTGGGWHHEAGIHVLRLILSGTFERYPGLGVISGHWGDMVPFYLQRLDDMLPPNITGLPRTITETYLNQVRVTPSGLSGLPHFQFIHTVMGADRIIWPVDYPYLTLDGTREFLGKLPVSEQDREKITHVNAEKLFKL
jgi:uncharacterized protein